MRSRGGKARFRRLVTGTQENHGPLGSKRRDISLPTPRQRVRRHIPPIRIRDKQRRLRHQPIPHHRPRTHPLPLLIPLRIRQRRRALRDLQRHPPLVCCRPISHSRRRQACVDERRGGTGAGLIRRWLSRPCGSQGMVKSRRLTSERGCVLDAGLNIDR